MMSEILFFVLGVAAIEFGMIVGNTYYRRRLKQARLTAGSGVQCLSMSPPMSRAKKQFLLDILSRSLAYLQIDGRAAGVDLPDGLRVPSVTLQIGHGMAVPIPDLTVDEEGVRATLSFRRRPHLCRVPWAAVWGIVDTDGAGVIFPKDLPSDLTNGAAPTGKPNLKLV